jgi:hypothetical protein
LGRRTILGLFNLTLDPWNGAAFELGLPPGQGAPTRVRRLTPSGRLAPDRTVEFSILPTGSLQVRTNRQIPFSEPLLLELEWTE